MDSNLKLQLELSLELLAAIGAVIHLWEKPNILQKIQDYFVNPSEAKWDYYAEWYDLNEMVYDSVRSLKLPIKIKKELHQLVPLIGERIFHWNKYVTGELGLDSRFARKIYWTCQGGIDECKIFQDFWQNESDFYSCKTSLNRSGSSLSMVACLFVQEDFIRNNLEKMVSNKIKFRKSTNQDYKVRRIVAIWLNLHFDRSIKASIKELLVICLMNGLDKAFKFLFNGFNFYLPQSALAEAAMICLENIVKGHVNLFKKEKLVDILLFLLKKMSLESKIRFLIKHKHFEHIVKGFLHLWPYQSFITQIIDFIAEVNSSTLETLYPILFHRIIMSKMRTRTIAEVYDDFADSIFIRILRMMPRDLKQEILFNHGFNICTNLFDFRTYKIINFILNDPDMLQLRDTIINQGSGRFRNDLSMFKFNEFDEWMTRLGLSEVEKRKLINKYNPLLDMDSMSRYIQFGSFEGLDKLILWLSDSEYERINIKMAINSTKIVSSVLQCKSENYSILDKDGDDVLDLRKLDRYLDWQFDTEEERISFKFKLDLTNVYRNLIRLGCHLGSFNAAFIDEVLNWQFGSDDEVKPKEIKVRVRSDEKFIYQQVLQLHIMNYSNRNEEIAKCEVFKFFKWFFDVIPEKRDETVANEDFVAILVECTRHMTVEESTIWIEKILEYCDLTTEKINEIKQTMLDYFCKLSSLV